MLKFIYEFLKTFLKQSTVWCLIFLGIVHCVTTLGMFWERKIARTFSYEEHVSLLIGCLCFAIIFGIGDAFRKKKNK